MLLYRCRVTEYMEEHIHQNLPENLVRNSEQAQGWIAYPIAHHLAGIEKGRDGQILTKASPYIISSKPGEGLINNVQWFNTICGLGEGTGKCSSSIYKKVVSHLQVPVMCMKQKYKVPNQLGN